MPLRSRTWRPGLRRGWGTGAWVPEELLEVWRVSQEPIFPFRILREGVEKQDGNWIGCGVAQNWNLPESGWGRQCLFSRPVSLGHVFSAVFLASAFGTSVKHQQTQGTFPLSGLLREEERAFPSFYLQLLFLSILTDDKTIRIRALLTKSNHPPTKPLKYTGASLETTRRGRS